MTGEEFQSVELFGEDCTKIYKMREYRFRYSRVEEKRRGSNEGGLKSFPMLSIKIIHSKVPRRVFNYII